MDLYVVINLYMKYVIEKWSVGLIKPSARKSNNINKPLQKNCLPVGPTVWEYIVTQAEIYYRLWAGGLVILLFSGYKSSMKMNTLLIMFY